ncbi:MAG: hypothetical protein SFY67_15055 [Candidatus Melainabacteria bacterium]|nr:hypothetical protein [Candidatus Melainabacteria bacterium]
MKNITKWLIPMFLFSLAAPQIPGRAEIAHDVDKPKPETTLYYPKVESCDKPATWGPAVSLHHKDPHAYYYFDEGSQTWRVKRPRPYGNVTYGTWWY